MTTGYDEATGLGSLNVQVFLNNFPNPMAAVTSPASGSTLAGATATFNWTAGGSVSQAWLWIGTNGAGSQNLGAYGGAGATSATASNLPTNGSTVYVRLWSFIYGAWLYNDYTYTAASQAAMVSPTPGSVLAGPSATFIWTAGPVVSQAWLWIGSAGTGSQNLGAYGGAGATSANPTNLPTNAGTIYVRLWSDIGGTWLYTDYTYTAASQAAMVSPTPGSVLPGPSVTFNWSGGGASQVFIWIGTSQGGNNLAQSGGAGATSFVASNLPTHGSTVYVRLWSLIGGAWLYTDYTYTAASQAAMVSPTSGSVLAGPSVTFNWTAGSGVSQAWLWIGSTGAGSQNLGVYGGAGVTSANPTNLPTQGSTVYVRLWSDIGGAWLYTDYAYTAASQAAMVSPMQGSTLAGATQMFTWSAGIGVSQAWIWAGTTGAGSQNLGAYGGAGVTSATPTNLPTDGSTVYVRL